MATRLYVAPGPGRGDGVSTRWQALRFIRGAHTFKLFSLCEILPGKKVFSSSSIYNKRETGELGLVIQICRRARGRKIMQPRGVLGGRGAIWMVLGEAYHAMQIVVGWIFLLKKF